MRLHGILLLGLAFCAAPDIATAAERRSCLSSEERRAVMSARKAVPLARAIRVVKAKLGGEVVKARLCRQDNGASAGSAKGLVYVLTVLARNGKVTQARVDAADGHWLGGS